MFWPEGHLPEPDVGKVCFRAAGEFPLSTLSGPCIGRLVNANTHGILRGKGVAMNRKPKVGDVFLIPLDDARCGIGQVAGDWRGELYVVVFDKVVSPDAHAEEAAGTGLLFAALTLDAKFFHGDWPIIGSAPDNLASIPQPVFKVDQGGQTYLETRDRSCSRKASPDEADNLRLRTVVAPIRIETALKAANGLGEWQGRFDELRADYAFSSSQFA